jgi:phage head maturation protease
MVQEVSRYEKEMINTDRAMGELNHPTTAEVDLERACHIVTEMKQDGNIFYGKSKVLNTPTGAIVKSLVLDGVRVGMSSRALGKIDQETDSEIGHVTEMKLVAIDCVADPSYSDAFVNGILESKQWILNKSGEFEEHFDRFEESLKKLPNRDVDEYLRNKFIEFIKNI